MRLLEFSFLLAFATEVIANTTVDGNVLATDETPTDYQDTSTLIEETTSGYESTTTGTDLTGETETSSTGEGTTANYQETAIADETTSVYQETTIAEDTTSGNEETTKTGETTSGYEETTAGSEDNSTNSTPTWDTNTQTSDSSSSSFYVTTNPSSSVISNFFSLWSFRSNPLTSTESVSSAPMSPSTSSSFSKGSSSPVTSLVSVGSAPISSPISSASEPPCDACNCNNVMDVGHPQPCRCPSGQIKRKASGNNVCCKAVLTSNWSWPRKCGGVKLSNSNYRLFPCGPMVEKNCGQCTNGGFQTITVGTVTGCCCNETPKP